MQINIPKWLVALVVVLVIVGGTVAAILLHPEWISGLFSKETPSPAPADDPSAQAVIAGVEAFYSLDYTEPVHTWLARVCAVTTPDGCEVIKSVYASPVHQVVQKNQVQTGCKATAIRMAEESEDGKTRVWLLEVTLTQPWAGVQSPMQIYADTHLDDDGVWRMNHILLDQETERFTTPTP